MDWRPSMTAACDSTENVGVQTPRHESVRWSTRAGRSAASIWQLGVRMPNVYSLKWLFCEQRCIHTSYSCRGSNPTCI
jgi:hypothetical protein